MKVLENESRIQKFNCYHTRKSISPNKNCEKWTLQKIPVLTYKNTDIFYFYEAELHMRDFPKNCIIPFRNLLIYGQE